MPSVSRERIEIVEGAGDSKARIAGSRIRVTDVAIWHEKMGMSPDEIVNEFPTITLADVHAALACYWDNRDKLEEELRQEHAYVEDARRRIANPLLEKLHRRRTARALHL
jgi:uncharacterized protein (DUF433 family)